MCPSELGHRGDPWWPQLGLFAGSCLVQGTQLAQRGWGQKPHGWWMCHRAGGTCCPPSPGHSFQGQGSQAVAGGPWPDLTPPPQALPCAQSHKDEHSAHPQKASGLTALFPCPHVPRSHNLPTPAQGHSTSGQRGESTARVTGKQKSLKSRQGFALHPQRAQKRFLSQSQATTLRV